MGNKEGPPRYRTIHISPTTTVYSTLKQIYPADKLITGGPLLVWGPNLEI